MIGVRSGAPRRARLAALGAHVPDRVVTNADLERIVDTDDEWIVSRTGIRERRWAAPDEASSDLGRIAGERALARAGVDAADLDLIIVPSATPDHLFPSTAAIIANAIGAERAAAYDLLAACSGFVYGLAQGAAMIESGLASRVLVIGAEVLSHVVDMTDRTTCVLFGDAAGAALLLPGDPDTTTGFLGFEIGADGSGGNDLIIPAGGGRMPMSCATSPSDGFLQMNGAEVFRFATRAMVDSVRRLLDAVDVTLDDIDLVVPHQANIRIIDHAAARLGIPESKLFNNLEHYGNTSSASIPLALTEARDAGRLRPGDLVLMVGFGAGLTWGSTVVRYEPVEVTA
jgi:3-oxoacyl-[acyl-carrier-protein] synthase-3